MVRRGAVALVSWATATVAASVVSVAGISLVTSQVTRAPLPAASEAETAPPASRATAATVATPVARDLQQPHAAGSQADVPRPTSTSATFGSAGGVVTASCEGPHITLSSASPASGYRLSVVSPGPDVVEVDFEGAQPTRTRLVCAGGQPVQQGSGDGPAATHDERGPSARTTAARGGEPGDDGTWAEPWDRRWGDDGYRGPTGADDAWRSEPGPDDGDPEDGSAHGDAAPGGHDDDAATRDDEADHDGDDPDEGAASDPGGADAPRQDRSRGGRPGDPQAPGGDDDSGS